MADTQGASAARAASAPELFADTVGGRITNLGPRVAQAGLPFLLVTYLGLRGGGYDIVVRSEIGIALWWITLFGVAVGALPLTKLSRSAWASLALLLAFGVWSGASLAWSESHERTLVEVGRVATLLGVLALSVAIQGPGAVRRTVGGIASGIAVVSAVAVLSRLQPHWFPALEAPELLPVAESRLHYPLGYWNGLAALAAIGIPLFLSLATSSRTVVGQSISLGAIPLLALTVFFTLSRGGVIEIAIGIVVLGALHPRWISLAARSAIAAVGSAIVIIGANQRSGLADGLATEASMRQGDEMLAILLVVCAGTACLGAAARFAERRALQLRRIEDSKRRAAAMGLAATIAALAITGLASGGASKLETAWSDFKNPRVGVQGSARLTSAAGGGRYQLWEAALDANKSQPAVGIGAGTFEYYWAQHGELSNFVRDAHSLYLETLAELGVVGIVLILLVVLIPFYVWFSHRVRGRIREREFAAGATAASATFVLAAGIDWAWELTVLPVIFFLLSGSLLMASSAANAWDSRAPLSPLTRSAVAAVALVALAAVTLPMAMVNEVRASQDSVRHGDLTSALDRAQLGQRVAPFAASPWLQQALVLEQQGKYEAAMDAARSAIRKEPTNWRNWLVLSRVSALAGESERAVRAHRRARALNPRSVLFDE